MESSDIHPGIYSIGHGTRPLDIFIGLLQQFNIAYLLDVRSIPYSRYNPQFNREALTLSLERHAIQYVYMGEALGGRPRDPDCYDASGRVDYTVVKRKREFLSGIERVKTAYARGFLVALMCSESRPSACHRSRLIGSVLYEAGISLRHIDEHGKLVTQEGLLTGMF